MEVEFEICIMCVYIKENKENMKIYVTEILWFFLFVCLFFVTKIKHQEILKDALEGEKLLYIDLTVKLTSKIYKTNQTWHHYYKEF